VREDAAGGLRPAPKQTLYVLDEPTVGLHMADVERLIQVLHRLVAAGNSAVVVEHNLDVMAEADWIIDLGPEAGDGGGRIVAQGAPAQIARRARSSHTGRVLEDFLRTHFPRVEAVILDFYHAAEHLGKLAKALCPGAEAAAQDLQETWCHQLKHEGGQALLTTLRALELRGKRPSVRATWAEEVGYFENQVHRMDYPTYRARGWQIGSGPVESACKRVVGQRLKGAGMRWGEDGADAGAGTRWQGRAVSLIGPEAKLSESGRSPKPAARSPL